MAAKVAEINVTGLKELRTAVRRLEPALVPEMRDRLKAAVSTATMGAVQRRISADLRATTVRPRRSSGRLAGSVRVVSGGNTIYIVGGKAKVPYYGWRDFGGVLKASGGRHNTQVRPFLKRGRYIYPAIDDTRAILVESVGRAFDDVERRVFR
jgi:hypothetical protein